MNKFDRFFTHPLYILFVLFVYFPICIGWVFDGSGLKGWFFIGLQVHWSIFVFKYWRDRLL